MIPIYISSDEERRKFPSRVLDSADFAYVPAGRAIELDHGFYEVALHNVTAWNSVRNVVNQSFRYNIGGSPYVNAIPDGLYTIEKLNDLLQGFLTALGQAGEIVVRPNFNTNRTEIVIVTGTTSFTMQGRLANLFGFAPLDVVANVTVSGTGTHVSPYVAQMSDGVDTWQVRCDLHTSAYDGRGESDIIFQFVPNATEGAKIDVTPLHLIYSQVNKITINSIRIRFTDQRGRTLDFNGEDTTVLLVLQRMR